MTERPGTVLILGASGGIGSATARRLAARGVPLVLAARGAERLEELARSLTGEGDASPDGGTPAPRVETLDAADFNAVDDVVRSIADEDDGPGLAGAVNCVGSMLLKPAHLTTRDELDALVEKNLTTAFALVRACARAMRAKGGSVVLLSSCAARTGLSNHEGIAAAKAAVEALARSAASSYARAGIRINAVAPGLTETPMTERIAGNDKARKASEAMHPLGRIGAPEEIAAAIDYLLGPDATWVTGQTLGVDGGVSTVRGR